MVRIPQGELEDAVIASAVCNGRQAGGGQVLAPGALLNDGMLDVVALYQFPIGALSQVIAELRDPDCNGRYVRRARVSWVEWRAADNMPINLDGEPREMAEVRFQVEHRAIRMVLPQDASMVLAEDLTCKAIR